jgi:hypothetical protein
MSQNYQEKLLVQTCLELDQHISTLSHRVGSNRFFEFGDDPRVVQQIELELMHVYRKVRSIASFFDLNHNSLRRANYYYDLIERVDDILAYLQEVQRKDCGSRQHTRELMRKLEDCSKSIYALSDLVGLNMEVIH